MIIKNIEEVQTFLSAHNHCALVISTTMHDGFVTCVKPIKYVCGAELICSPNTFDLLERVVRDAQKNEFTGGRGE